MKMATRCSSNWASSNLDGRSAATHPEREKMSSTESKQKAILSPAKLHGELIEAIAERAESRACQTTGVS